MLQLLPFSDMWQVSVSTCHYTWDMQEPHKCTYMAFAPVSSIIDCKPISSENSSRYHMYIMDWWCKTQNWQNVIQFCFRHSLWPLNASLKQLIQSSRLLILSLVLGIEDQVVCIEPLWLLTFANLIRFNSELLYYCIILIHMLYNRTHLIWNAWWCYCKEQLQQQLG